MNKDDEKVLVDYYPEDVITLEVLNVELNQFSQVPLFKNPRTGTYNRIWACSRYSFDGRLDSGGLVMDQDLIDENTSPRQMIVFPKEKHEHSDFMIIEEATEGYYRGTRHRFLSGTPWYESINHHAELIKKQVEQELMGEETSDFRNDPMTILKEYSRLEILENKTKDHKVDITFRGVWKAYS